MVILFILPSSSNRPLILDFFFIYLGSFYFLPSSFPSSPIFMLSFFPSFLFQSTHFQLILALFLSPSAFFSSSPLLFSPIFLSLSSLHFSPFFSLSTTFFFILSSRSLPPFLLPNLLVILLSFPPSLTASFSFPPSLSPHPNSCLFYMSC